MLLHRIPQIRLLAAALLILAAALGGGRHLHGSAATDADGRAALDFVAALGGEICLADPEVETAPPARHGPAGQEADCVCCLTGCLGVAALPAAAAHVHASPRRRAPRRGRARPARPLPGGGRRPSDPAPRAPPSPPLVRNA